MIVGRFLMMKWAACRDINSIFTCNSLEAQMQPRRCFPQFWILIRLLLFEDAQMPDFPSTFFVSFVRVLAWVMGLAGVAGQRPERDSVRAFSWREALLHPQKRVSLRRALSRAGWRRGAAAKRCCALQKKAQQRSIAAPS